MTRTFDAWWLPEGTGDASFETLGTGALICRYPDPTPGLLEETVRGLRAAGRALSDRPVDDIVQAVDRAAARFADLTDPFRRRAELLVTAATGYAPEMTRLVLDRMVADWRAEPVRRLLRSELGDPTVLDRFVPDDTGRRVRAYGPELSFHVFAGNVPGVAVTSVIRSLLVKSPVLGKLASGQPVLPVLFAEALHTVDPDVGKALALWYWPGGAADAEWRVLEAADAVVVYGGPDAVESIRARVPARARLVVHGPRFSVGLVGAGSLAALDEIAGRVARAVAAFDQHGCVSPHAIWVEEAGESSVAEFAGALARALERVETELPRGRIGAPEASAIQQERGAAEMRGHAEGGVRVYSSTGTAWTVVLDEEPTFRPSCLNRFVHVHPVAALEEAVDVLSPVASRLQSVAIEGAGAALERIAHRLARIGASRITTFDRLPWPPPEWHHDGRGPIRELLRWVDLEQEQQEAPDL